MRKIFFFDIDGTLLDTSRFRTQLHPALRTALNSLRQQGHIIAACSARQLNFVEKWLPNTFDCLILMNGSYVKIDDTVLLDAPLSPKDISRINRCFESYHGSYIYVGNSNGWAYNIASRHQKRLDKIYMLGDGYTLFEPLPHDAKIYLVDMFFETATDFERIQPVLSANNWMSLNYCCGDFTGDISLQGRTKVTAAKLVLDYYGLNSSAAYAFGDGINDLELFQLAQYTCAVANAKPELKSKALFVSTERAGLGVLQCLQHWDLFSAGDHT
ncbi:MAG: Cof-type HAD-IIB family hydrolase [Lachnospiraceae bacterium]|nr:Cof-type HAD-IIB family hydrolase [Lachnospiraceae bacterium]MCM1235958.1 Cof-type HAD-IIB family hydrolase [Ruminococcus flavefaciens]